MHKIISTLIWHIVQNTKGKKNGFVCEKTCFFTKTEIKTDADVKQNTETLYHKVFRDSIGVLLETFYGCILCVLCKEFKILLIL